MAGSGGQRRPAWPDYPDQWQRTLWRAYVLKKIGIHVPRIGHFGPVLLGVLMWLIIWLLANFTDLIPDFSQLDPICCRPGWAIGTRDTSGLAQIDSIDCIYPVAVSVCICA